MSILRVKECISLLCRTCEPNIFVHLYTGYPFIGIFVNLDTRFVKSLGMLTSTALQACLIPFSSLFLFLPGPPGTSYRFSLSGPLGWQSGIATHALRQDYSLISGWHLSVLKKTNKKTKKENLRVSLTQYFCLSPPENSFQPFAQIHCWFGWPLFSYPVLCSCLPFVENLFAYCSLLSNLLRVNVT